MDSVHRTVLLNETIAGLDLHPGYLVLDCTFGGGGHSREILEKYPNVKIIALDQDQNAWEKAKSKFKGLEGRITFLNKNFRDIDDSEIDGIIFDLGLSSDQLENSGRGFSFLKNEPLLMTLKEPARLGHSGGNPSEYLLTAYDVVNAWSEKSLADIIYGYGEERYSRRIARGIIEARKKSKIENTFDLVKIIEKAVPGAYRRRRLHFATRTFQAIRIAVNDELGALKEGLEKGFNALKAGGRMSVISFHSLEDRIVKRFFSAKGGSASGGQENRVAKLINKKPITAQKKEINNNPRARSAKLRILEKL
ncbi:MAG: 16S rRNA (cytosine(1402)-N(4))-methyltransferase RsmH [Patescibacteria group bacterium]